jgi:tRNA G37 N-methylase Trm5
MVKCFRTKKENTQELKKFLRSKGWFDDKYKIGHSGKYVLLPVTEKSNKKSYLINLKELLRNVI